MKLSSLLFIILFPKTVSAQYVLLEARRFRTGDIVTNGSYGASLGYAWEHFSVSCLYARDGYDNPYLKEKDNDHNIHTLGSSLKWSLWKNGSIGNICIQWYEATQIAGSRKGTRSDFNFTPYVQEQSPYNFYDYTFNRLALRSVFSIGPSLNIGNFQLNVSGGWVFTIASGHHTSNNDKSKFTRFENGAYLSFGASYYIDTRKFKKKNNANPK